MKDLIDQSSTVITEGKNPVEALIKGDQFSNLKRSNRRDIFLLQMSCIYLNKATRKWSGGRARRHQRRAFYSNDGGAQGGHLE